MLSEEMAPFQPKFNKDGLIGAIIIDAVKNDILMFAYMNADALRLTRDTGLIHFYSRSRQKIWKKGETSSEILKVVQIWVDCDQDTLLISATLEGPKAVACHTGRRSCFYRLLQDDQLIEKTPK